MNTNRLDALVVGAPLSIFLEEAVNVRSEWIKWIKWLLLGPSTVDRWLGIDRRSVTGRHIYLAVKEPSAAVMWNLWLPLFTLRRAPLASAKTCSLIADGTVHRLLTLPTFFPTWQEVNAKKNPDWMNLNSIGYSSVTLGVSWRRGVTQSLKSATKVTN